MRAWGGVGSGSGRDRHSPIGMANGRADLGHGIANDLIRDLGDRAILQKLVVGNDKLLDGVHGVLHGHRDGDDLVAGLKLLDGFRRDVSSVLRLNGRLCSEGAREHLLSAIAFDDGAPVLGSTIVGLDVQG
jgi:hypothetical protein